MKNVTLNGISFLRFSKIRNLNFAVRALRPEAAVEGLNEGVVGWLTWARKIAFAMLLVNKLALAPSLRL